MPDHSSIYKQEAEKYHQLIAKQPLLETYIEQIKSIRGADIVDLGAGTGRLTCALAPHAQSITAVDASAAMLSVTEDRLRRVGLSNWETKVADLKLLPLADHSADLVVAGWSICYVANSNEKDWGQNLEQVLAEAMRVLRPNGTMIIFETMGTGTTTPNPPHFLLDYYAQLVERYGFKHEWIRLDYTFDDIEQAETLTRFFFGDEVADQVVKQELVTVPECAGIWWLHKQEWK